jgi:hypothetical protein
MARLLADSTVKSPEIMPEPPVMGSRMTGAETTSLSSTIAKGRPTFSWVARASRRVPAALNRKRMTGCLGIERRLYVDHAGAIDEHVLAHQERNALAGLFLVKHLGILGRSLAQGFLRGHREVDQAKFELAGRREQRGEPGWVAQARRPHSDAAFALRLDRGIGHAKPGEAPLDDRDRLGDGILPAFDDRDLRRRQTHQAAACIGYVGVRRQVAQLAERGIEFGVHTQRHFDGIAVHGGRACPVDAGFAQRRPDLVAQQVERRLANIGLIDLEDDGRGGRRGRLRPRDRTHRGAYRQHRKDSRRYLGRGHS